MNTPAKRCTKCGKMFPITDEFFYKTTTGFHQAKCRICVKARQRDYVARNHDKVIAAHHTWKKNNPTKNKEVTRKWKQVHQGQEKERKRQWYERNKEKVKQKDRINHRKSAYLEHQKERKRLEYKVHPEKFKAAARRHRASRRNLPHTFTDQDWTNALKYWHGGCAYCGHGPSLFDTHFVLHKEHFIPNSKGGGYTADNIIPACQNCNLPKSSKNALDWLISKYGKTVGTRKYKAILEYFEKVGE